MGETTGCFYVPFRTVLQQSEQAADSLSNLYRHIKSDQYRHSVQVNIFMYLYMNTCECGYSMYIQFKLVTIDVIEIEI
jgi:hypothetical protein